MLRNGYTQAVIACAVLLAACAEPDEPAGDEAITDRYGEITTTSTSEPVPYSPDPYEFTGQTPIADLYGLIPAGEFVWYGTSPEFPSPYGETCGARENTVEELPALPTEIEGIVTLHPRYFQKVGYCGSDERYYGSYLIQDESGGILILKDSRIADFTFGDRVRLRVLGLMKYFDTRAVVAHSDEEVVSRGNDVYFEELEDRLLRSQDVGKTIRFRGVVGGEATNQNFNEMCLIPEGGDPNDCDPECIAIEQCGGYVFVSIDRELGQRNPEPVEQGDLITVTGPVVNSFGLRILVSDAGQISFIEE